jgi:hypothetical protein
MATDDDAVRRFGAWFCRYRQSRPTIMLMAKTCDSETALLQGQLQSPNATGNLLVEYSGFSTNGRFSQKNPMDLTYIRNPGIETRNSRFEI